MKTIQPLFFIFLHLIKSAATIKKTMQCACLVLNAGLAHAQEVKMYTGCNVVLTGDIYVVLNNTAFKNNGTFTAGSSTVKFTGDTDTGIAYLSGSSNTRFNNLTLNKSVYGISLNSSVGVKNVLTLSSGHLYSNSNLTLLSDSANTARLAVVPAGAYISGTAMVERYIPSKRAWRLMTAPVTNSASIYNAWQNGGVYTPEKGLLISAPGGGNGLDNGNAASLKKWDVSNQLLLPVTNTYTRISATNSGSADNTGYFVFIRGDRNPVNFNVPNTNTTTITGIGSLQTGAQTFSASSIAGGYTLIGNPYASPIDFNAVTRTNLVKRFYVWDPTINAMGGYVTLDDLDNDGLYIKSVSPSAQTQEIQSSQAFFVETYANGAASFTVNETAKSTVNNSNVFRPAAVSLTEGKAGSIRANMYLLNHDNTLVLADGALAEFGNGFTDNVNNEDAIKFTNINENIGFTRHAVTLAIERRPVISLKDTLFLKLGKTKQRNYQLQLITENIEQPGLIAYLEDRYLATSVPIVLSGTAAFNFTVDANPASSIENRFSIIFKQLSVLPVAFTAIKAYPLNNNIQVDWQVQDETGILKYDVEKSATGLDFNQVYTTANNSTVTYSRIDSLPFSGKNFYRIKSTSRNGAIKYSPVVYVLVERKASHFTIQPNPVKGNSIHLRFAKQPQGNYQFNLINGMGQVAFSTRLTISSNSMSQELKTNKELPAGLYQLQITGPANTIEIQKVMIQP